MLTFPWYYQPAISDPYQSEALRRKFFGNARSADLMLVRATRDSNFWHPSHCAVLIRFIPPLWTDCMSTLDRFGSIAYALWSVCRVSMVVYCVSYSDNDMQLRGGTNCAPTVCSISSVGKRAGNYLELGTLDAYILYEPKLIWRYN